MDDEVTSAQLTQSDHVAFAADAEETPENNESPAQELLSDNEAPPAQEHVKPTTLSHFKRPQPKPVLLRETLVDDLSFENGSASQTYEKFIKEAYSKAQKQLQQSRDLIEWQSAQEIGNTRESVFFESRPIRTFARHNDTTHVDADSAEDAEAKFACRKAFRLDSTDSADEASSSSANSSEEYHYRPRASESSSLYGSRRYYSRSSDDPDYFDFDLRHAVEQCRGKRIAIAAPPLNHFEQRLFADRSKMSGQATISSYMFAGAGEERQKRCTNFISSALRTASYWEYRYQHLDGPKP